MKVMNVAQVSQQVLHFCETMAEMKLYPYQKKFALRLIQSVLQNDGDEITALFARQSGKCLAKGTEVLMFDGSTKRVEDIKIGDKVMGDDSTPRNVISLAHGHDEMFEIVPRVGYAESYTVNKSHILSLMECSSSLSDLGDTCTCPPKKVDMCVQDYLKLPAQKKDAIRGYKVAVEYPEKALPIEPYFMGLWLGSGAVSDTSITSQDKEVVEYLADYAKRLGLTLKKYQTKGKYPSWVITSGGVTKGERVFNPIRSYLVAKFRSQSKFIPQLFLTASRKQRMELLAGIIDSDGYIQGNFGEVTFSNKKLALQTQTLLWSLGFRCSLSSHKATCSNFKVHHYPTVWRCNFYGSLHTIPTKVARKQVSNAPLLEDPLSYEFDVVPKGKGEYFGFCLDGNKRFLLSDFTVTHNTETVSTVVAGMLVILPYLAKLEMYKHDERLQRFRAGLWVGIFAPIKEQADIPFNRIGARLDTNTARKLLRNPNLGLNPKYPYESNNGTTIALSNGSICKSRSASDQSNIEGQTYHVIICEECQDISNSKIRKSIHPMAAATNGTLVKIGTPSTTKGEFYDSIQRNKRIYAAGGVQSHFEFDYRIASHYNPLYGRYVEKEKYRLGEDSDEFRMSYRLHWILERGMFVSPAIFDSMGFDFKKSESEEPVPYEIVTSRRGTYQTCGIDFGKNSDSTVVTILEQGPVLDEGRYGKRILNWLELYGDDYEEQFYQILDFLQNYNVSRIYADATGVGDGPTDRLYRALSHIDVVPIHFTLQYNSQMAKYLSMEFQSLRIRYPNGPKSQETLEHRKFVQQFLDWEKSYNGQYMVCSHPDEKGAHDDYCWSLALANMAMEEVSQDDMPAVESGGNVFFSMRR